MNTRIYRIFIKSMKEQIRDWKTLATSLALPVIFMVIFGLAFGASYYTYKIVVIDKDKGIPGGKKLSDEFIERLKSSGYEDGTKIFNVTILSSREGVDVKLQKHDAVASITISEDFSMRLSKVAGDAESKGAASSKLVIEGDPGYPSFSLVKMMFDSVLVDYASEKTGVKFPVESETIYMGAKRSGSEFDYIAPGLMLFAIFMLIFQVSMVLVKESETKTLRRLLLAPVKQWELLWGISLTQILFSLVMVPVMFAAAISVGFQSQGSLLLGMFVGILAAFSAIALGLWVAAFSRNSTQAFLISNALIVPVVFLSGTFFPLPKISLFTIGGRAFSVFELQPATHAVNAFTRIFLYGAGLGDILYELTMLVFISFIFFLTGLWFWKKGIALST